MHMRGRTLATFEMPSRTAIEADSKEIGYLTISRFFVCAYWQRQARYAKTKWTEKLNQVGGSYGPKRGGFVY